LSSGPYIVMALYSVARTAALYSVLYIAASYASETALTTANDLAISRALESAGVEFIDENGGGPGVRLRKRHPKSG